MTATASPASSAIAAPVGTGVTPSLWRAGASAGLAAALATSAVAAVAKAVDVPIEIAGEAIPMVGFAQLTLVCTLLGVLIAKGARRWAGAARTAFIRTTVALTALSIVPDLTADATTATKVTLILTHLVAAAIVIPRLAARLDG